ncbi:MAG: CCA tRNA nucleotidyltransferase [Nanoarchaeota archaeon]|nr:CCA tRNA nucleotidyltransferase [Nanoarchaeota archaeon]
MDEVLKQVIKKVKPGSEEVKKLESVTNEIISKLKLSAESLRVSPEIVMGGSAARGTWMSGNHDLDFFMRFSDEKSISKYYKKIVTPCFKNMSLVHGTRDYYKFNHKGFDIEIVPSIKYDIPSKAVNSADISYFHIEYLKKKYANNPRLKNEVLLLKQFMKANEVYGAESARGGFSGYVCELLIVYFKSFKNLVNFFEKAKPKIIIDIEKNYKSSEEALKKIDENKTSGPLIIIDPLLPERNASASVSYPAFSEFLFRIRYFLREPLLKLFNERGLSSELVKERSKRRGTKLLMYKIKQDRADFDVVKAKLLRKVKQLSLMLDREGWQVYSYGVADEKKLFIELESLNVSKAKKHYGPFVWVETEFFDNFFKKWKNNVLGKPYTYNNKLVVDVYRKHDVNEVIKEYLKDYLC